MTEIVFIDGIGHVEVTNWEEFVHQLGFLLGNELQNQIQEEGMKMRLFDSGRYIRGMRFEQDGTTLVFTNDAPYAEALEYGTYEFGGLYTEDAWPNVPFPKKKNISRELARRFPRGMQPFATYRRVLYSEERVGDAIKAVAGAPK